MQQIFTPSQLLLLLYNETSQTEANSIRDVLQDDGFLREEFEKLVDAKHMLDESGGDNPGKSTLEKIMRYSAHEVLESV